MKPRFLALAGLSILSSLALAQPAPTPSAPFQSADCPQLDEQLPELLASAKQRVGRDGGVRVEFEVDAQGRARPIQIDGDRPYRSAVRLAMDAVECRPGRPQRYVLNIRFEDPPPAPDAVRYARR
jgi:hypothetical protein